jgi:hypothetical protein
VHPRWLERAPHLLSPSSASRARSYPAQLTTGSRGYFGNRVSVCERAHSENDDPFALVITFWCLQELQSPASMWVWSVI